MIMWAACPISDLWNATTVVHVSLVLLLKFVSLHVDYVSLLMHAYIEKLQDSIIIASGGIFLMVEGRRGRTLNHTCPLLCSCNACRSGPRALAVPSLVYRSYSCPDNVTHHKVYIQSSLYYSSEQSCASHGR